VGLFPYFVAGRECCSFESDWVMCVNFTDPWWASSWTGCRCLLVEELVVDVPTTGVGFGAETEIVEEGVGEVGAEGEVELGVLVDVGEEDAPVIVNVAVVVGFNWFTTTNVPVTAAPVDVPTLGTPFQVPVRVKDCPGCNVSATMKRGLIPAFDCQTVAPACLISKPSVLGPSLMVTAWLVLFVSVNVSCTGWPTSYDDAFVVRATESPERRALLSTDSTFKGVRRRIGKSLQTRSLDAQTGIDEFLSGDS
jgi:hypothetical protein